MTQQERIRECDDERQRDKELLQDLIFEQKRQHKLED